MCNRYGNRGFGMRHEHFKRGFGGHREHRSSDFRVPVNIAKNETGYELFIFAPDRTKEDFKIRIKGHELTIAYEMKAERPESKNWVRHEFAKTPFERSFMIDETIDAENISAVYTNGILQLTLPVIPGSEKPVQDIPVA